MYFVVSLRGGGGEADGGREGGLGAEKEVVVVVSRAARAGKVDAGWPPERVSLQEELRV